MYEDNSKRYGAAAQPSLSHRRSVSQTMPIVEGQDPAMISRAALSPQIDPDVFPPLRSHASDPAVFSPYIPEDIAFEEEYEDYLSEVGEGDTSVGSLGDVVGPPVSTGAAPSNEERGSAWRRLADFAGEVGDGISDSESIVSIGDLGDESKYEPPADENLNNWEVRSLSTLLSIIIFLTLITPMFPAYEP